MNSINRITKRGITMKHFKLMLMSSLATIGFFSIGAIVNADEIEHEVVTGDTLSAISLQYFGNVDHVQQIAEDNQIENPSLIFTGSKLMIYTEDSILENGSSTTNVVTKKMKKQTSTTKKTTVEKETQTNVNYSGRTIVMESTAYSSDPRDSLGGGTITATGQNLLKNPMAVAVDPNVIPLGTRLYVEGYGEAIASDTGGAIKGNIVDVHFPTYEECVQWGRRSVRVTILD